MCTALGREAPLEIIGGIFGAALASSNNEETAAILPMFESLAERTDQPLHSFAGHQVLGVHACWSGRHERALEHTTAGMDLYRRSSVRDISWEYGFGLYCYGYGMSALYHRGFAGRAEDGITPIRLGVGLLETLGFSCSHGYYLMYLAEALIAVGETDEASPVNEFETLPVRI